MNHLVKQEVDLTLLKLTALTMDFQGLSLQGNMIRVRGHSSYELESHRATITVSWVAFRQSDGIWTVASGLSGHPCAYRVLARNGVDAHIINLAQPREVGHMATWQVDQWLEKELAEHVDWHGHVLKALEKST